MSKVCQYLKLRPEHMVWSHTRWKHRTVLYFL